MVFIRVSTNKIKLPKTIESKIVKLLKKYEWRENKRGSHYLDGSGLDGEFYYKDIRVARFYPGPSRQKDPGEKAIQVYTTIQVFSRLDEITKALSPAFSVKPVWK